MIIMSALPHPPGDTEVMRNNESHWSGLIIARARANDNNNNNNSN